MGCPMTDEDYKRKLAAILSADVEGYSSLMDDDEEATVRTLTAYRDVINESTRQFRDGWLILPVTTSWQSFPV